MAEMVPAHPVGGVDYPKTFQQLLAWFPDDESCLNYLADLRWPDGFVCPACESGRYWRTAKARWMCAVCGRQTSVTPDPPSPPRPTQLHPHRRDHPIHRIRQTSLVRATHLR